jgi:hypothetical protein
MKAQPSTVARFENEWHEPNPAAMLAIRNDFEAAASSAPMATPMEFVGYASIQRRNDPGSCYRRRVGNEMSESREMTLSYELAKQLREAGWPQFSNGDDPDDEYPHPLERYVEDSETVDTAYSPSLEELIERCPLELNGTYFTMRRTEAGFWAGYLNVKSGVTPFELCGIGEHNFKEAVARLWLRLNAKPKP